MKAIFTIAFIVVFGTCCILCKRIELIECKPPDVPKWGGYGPKLSVYSPGDVIHYFCNVDTHIGGNYYRFCMDSGNWVGETPVCDEPATFVSVEQTSTEQPEEDNGADMASDNDRESCSSTQMESDGRTPTWTATLEQPSQVLRVMLFLPIGRVAYEVLTERNDGSIFSCGRGDRIMERHEWTFHNCLAPNNTDIVKIKIRSLNSIKLELCDVVTHVLTDPTCVDPHYFVESGHLLITRKSAELKCDKHFQRGNNANLTCLRTGVWTQGQLHCLDSRRQVDTAGTDEWDSVPNGPERERMSSGTSRK